MTFSPAFQQYEPASSEVKEPRPAERRPAGYDAMPPHAGNLHSGETIGNMISVINITEARRQYPGRV
jgi:hypothetical protein